MAKNTSVRTDECRGVLINRTRGRSRSPGNRIDMTREKELNVEKLKTTHRKK